MKKNQIRGYIVLGILFILFTIISFAVPFHKNVIFVLAYVCGVVAILSQIYFFKVSFSKEETPKSVFYGIPIARIGVIYLCVQIIASFIEMLMVAIMPVWVLIIINAIIIAMAILGCIATDTMRDEVVKQETNKTKNTSKIKELQIIALNLKNKCDDEKARIAIEKVIDTLKYVDPVTVEASVKIENEIDNKMKSISRLIESKEVEPIIKTCEEIVNKLEERNKICKLNK